MNTIRYHRTTRFLHWTQAALLIGMLTLGWWMVTLDYTNRWYTSALFWHRVCGLLVVPIAVLQLWCRRRHPMPPLVHDWRRVGADAMHRLFLCLMFLFPLSGYLLSTSSGAAVPLPGGLALPAMVDFEPLEHWAHELHHWFAYILAVAAGLHLLAALHHHFVTRDEVLRRML